MKIGFSIFFSLTISFLALGQNVQIKSDLRLKVDSIIKHQIGYQIDSTTNQLPDKNWDPSKKRGLYPSFSTLSGNPMTLIIMGGEAIEIEELNKYELKEVASMRIFPKNDKTTGAIYGERAKNGMIVIELKE